MGNIFVKRNSVVEAERFDPARADQGVTVVWSDDAAPVLLGATLLCHGRPMGVRPGDWIVTQRDSRYPIGDCAFRGLFRPVSEVRAEGGEGGAHDPV